MAPFLTTPDAETNAVRIVLIVHTAGSDVTTVGPWLVGRGRGVEMRETDWGKPLAPLLPPPVPQLDTTEPPDPPRLPKPARAHGDPALARVRMFNRKPRTFPRKRWARVARNTLGY